MTCAKSFYRWALPYPPKNFDRLLETIVVEAKAICNADAATLYLRTEDERLAFTVMRTYSLNLAYGGPDAPAIPIAPLPLFMPNSGQPNHNNIATYVALTGQSVNIPDVYNAAEFDFPAQKRSTNSTTIALFPV